MDKKAKIGILGGGVEGLSAAKYLQLHGFENVLLLDIKEKLADMLPSGLKFYGGVDYLKKAEECDVVFRSPGIHIGKLENLHRKGVQVTSTTQYFMENCPCKIIGVTGTKGKGTTATLIQLMLKEAGCDVYLGGNIGLSPLDFLDRLKPESVVVFELSSFQLQDLKMSPQIAIVLHVASDHLDYHADGVEYLAAKSAIVRFQKPGDLAIFNEDYQESKYYSDLTPAKNLWVSTQKKVGDGAFVENGKIFFADYKNAGVDGKPEFIAGIAKIALPGAHNLENVLPTVCAARSLSIPVEAIQKVLYSFAGLPHRLEFVKEVRGVRYYNDSISTTPETSMAACHAFKSPIILIAGGSEKGAFYDEWAFDMQTNPNVKMIVLVGQMAERMEKSLIKAEKNLAELGEKRSYKLKILRCKSFEEAVQKAKQDAVKGDCVILSPAAASFDAFKNYRERGERFRELVNKF